MIIKVIHPVTEENISIEVGSINLEGFQSAYKVVNQERSIVTAIENLDLPAEAKGLLLKIKDFSLIVGKDTLEIGKKILEMIIWAVKKFPSASIGLVVGTFIGITLSSIPLLGWALGWLIQPLCVALGLALGFWKDISSDDIKASINKAIDQMFASLKDVPVPSKA